MLLRDDFASWLMEAGFAEQSEAILRNLAKAQSSMIRAHETTDSLFDPDSVGDIVSAVQRLSNRRVVQFSLDRETTAIRNAFLVYKDFLT